MKKPRPSRLLLLPVIILLLASPALLIPGPAWGQTSWTGDVSEDWFDPYNWDNGVPDANINAYIDNGGNPVINSGSGTPEARTLIIDNGSTFTQSGGTATISNFDPVGGDGLNVYSGTVDHSGGTLYTNWLTLGGFNPAGSTYNLSDTAEVYTLTLGVNQYATFNQDGGFLQVDWFAQVDNGTYNLYNGTLQTPSLEVGVSGSGQFNQSGGYLYVDDLTLGTTATGSGAYSLNDGYLNIGNNIYIGYDGSGAFTQNGGSHTVEWGLVLGRNAGSSGAYYLNDGSLEAYQERIGREGSGTFNQTGGANSVYGDLFVGGAEYTSGGSGTYNLSGAGQLSVDNQMIIGHSGTGTFNQTGGTVSVSGDLILGQQTTGSGNYYQHDGEVSVNNNFIVGGEGFGHYELSQGALRVWGDFIVGQSGNQWNSVQLGDPYNASLTSTTAVYGNMSVGESGTGLNEVWLYYGSSLGVGQIGNEKTLYIGKESGSWGHFNQQGGNLTVNGNLIIGENSNAPPGQFNVFAQANLYYDWWPYAVGTTHVTGDMIVGNAGAGLALHKLGSIQVDGALILGNQPGSFGEYRLNKPHPTDPIDPNLYTGTLNVGSLVVGGSGTGIFQMSGGSLSVQQDLVVASAGTGTFTQTGGSATVTNAVNIGTNSTSSGAYTMSSGTLTTNDLTVGSPGPGSVTGALALTNALAKVYVGGNFTINEQGQFTAASGVTVEMTGSNFYNNSLDPHNVDMSQMRMFFSNMAASDTFEVAGLDLGTSMAGFNNNFALGTLELTAGATLTLEDLIRNQGVNPEVLYVSSLILGDGSTLDLGDLHLYYLNEILGSDVHFLNGLPQQAVPLPRQRLAAFERSGGVGALKKEGEG